MISLYVWYDFGFVTWTLPDGEIRQETAHNISDLYTKQLGKVMEKIQDHKYSRMGKKIIGMDKPYIYLTDYSMDSELHIMAVLKLRWVKIFQK